jgi:hypothetical protein
LKVHRAITAAASSPLPHDRLIELDRQLAAAARGAGALRLEIGEGLQMLAEHGGHHELGFSSLAAYALERCQQSGRWATDSAIMARRLAALPKLRAALATGALGFSMVELLSRHATSDSEERLLGLASKCTVRQMRAQLAAESTNESSSAEAAAATEAAEDDAEPCVLTLTLDRWELWLLECTAWLVRTIEPGATWDTVFEGIVAEGWGTLRELVPGSTSTEPPSDSQTLRDLSAAWSRQRAAWRTEAEARSEPRLESTGEPKPSFEPVARAPAEPAEPAVIDAHIQRLSRELAERDLLLGVLAERFFRADGWRRLGYGTEHQYARERLGLSLSSLKAKRHLAARCSHLPQVADTLAHGRLGFEGALLVTRVATPSTVAAWVERAGQRTVKQLREEVDIAEVGIRLTGVREQLPPDEEAVRQFGAARRETSELLAKLVGQSARGAASQISGAEPELALPSTRDLWHDFRHLFRKARQRLPDCTTLMSFLISSFWQTWAHRVLPDVAYAHIYARDGFRCTNPVCTRRDITPHHLEFRSAGGDHDENVTSLCVWCHLSGVHEGRIQAEPPASHIRWVLGRKPLLVVEGRTKCAALHA